MIPKVVRSKDGRGSGGTGFSGAIDYIINKADGVALHNVTSEATAAREMRAVANQSTKIKKPVYHMILSWAELERPTNEQMFEAAREALGKIGADAHQAVIAIHRDRDHHHVHIVMNKIGLDGHSLNLSNDFARLEAACREIEAKQGWSQDRGRFDAVMTASGEVELTPKDYAKKTDRELRQDEIDMERRTGREPLLQLLRRDDVHEKLAAAIEQARNWHDLHQSFADMGLRYVAKGSGAKIVNVLDDSESVSPSHIEKSWARSKLEARLGAFVESAPYQSKTIAAIMADIHSAAVKPRSDDNAVTVTLAPSVTDHAAARARLWQQFEIDRRHGFDAQVSARKKERDSMTARHRAERSDLFDKHQARLSAGLRAFAGIPFAKPIVRLVERVRAERETRPLKERQAKERKILRAEQQRQGWQKAPEWRQWLAARAQAGDLDAAKLDQSMSQRRNRDAMSASGYGNRADELQAMRRLDLPRVAEAMGFEIDKRESTSLSIKLRRGADIAIARPERDGSWSFFDATGTNSGGVIQFVQAHRGGGNLGEVRAFLRPMLDSAAATMPNDRPKPERDHTAARQAWVSASDRVPAFLAERGIDAELAARIGAGQIKTDRRGNALFAHADHAGNIVGFEVKGPTWAGFAKGGAKTIATFGDPGARQSPSRIVITESGIDALSLAQIEGRKDSLYVSLGGAVGNRSIAELTALQQAHPHATVQIGTDSDKAGHELAARIGAAIPAATRILPMTGKDWNDDLRNRQADAANKAEELAREIKALPVTVAVANKSRSSDFVNHLQKSVDATKPKPTANVIRSDRSRGPDFSR